jgi:hypothetical protein
VLSGRFAAWIWFISLAKDHAPHNSERQDFWGNSCLDPITICRLSNSTMEVRQNQAQHNATRLWPWQIMKFTALICCWVQTITGQKLLFYGTNPAHSGAGWSLPKRGS